MGEQFTMLTRSCTVVQEQKKKTKKDADWCTDKDTHKTHGNHKDTSNIPASKQTL